MGFISGARSGQSRSSTLSGIVYVHQWEAPSTQHACTFTFMTVSSRTGQFSAEYRRNWLLHLQRMPQSLWNHTTTDHKEAVQLEDRRSVGASSCNSVDGMGQRVQSLMIMMMMVIPYPPFSTMASSRYSVLSMVLKLWITIMQLWKTFPSFGRKLKENWLNLMSAVLHCLWFHY